MNTIHTTWPAGEILQVFLPEKPASNGGVVIEGGINIMKTVPIWEKSNLTLEEAAAYSGIGKNKLRELSDESNCSFVLWNGNKRPIKRKELDKFTSGAYSI